MKCPSCGAADLVRGTRDVPYTYKGEQTVVSGVSGDSAPRATRRFSTGMS